MRRGVDSKSVDSFDKNHLRPGYCLVCLPVRADPICGWLRGFALTELTEFNFGVHHSTFVISVTGLCRFRLSFRLFSAAGLTS